MRILRYILLSIFICGCAYLLDRSIIPILWNLFIQDSRHIGQGYVTSVGYTPNLVNDSGPSLEHEHLRRQTEDTVREAWHYMNVQLQNILKDNITKQGISSRIVDLVKEGALQQRLLLTNLFQLQENDGYMDWRKRESEHLKGIIRNRIEHIQNPENCSAAKKLVCDMKRGAGFGSLLNDILYCLLVAYSTQRMLVVDSSRWHYSRNGWEKVYQPLSQTCQQKIEADGLPELWGVNAATKDVLRQNAVRLPIAGHNYPKPAPSFLPEAIPKDLATRLIRLHGYPFLWWESNFLNYLTRPSDRLRKTIENTEQFHQFKTPIVGVHIRRTDKLQANSVFHRIEEYMDVVEEYYLLLAMRQPVEEKRIYLATDDPTVLPEAKQKYPDYLIISNHMFSQSAGKNTRYTEESMFGIATDIHLLSRTDYLVCTLSSNVCRKAYEMMQYFHLDATERIKTLDKRYFFFGGLRKPHVVIHNHTSINQDELDIQVGDRIKLDLLQSMNGYFKGTNTRTRNFGLVPSYKVVPEPTIGDFPDYSYVDNLIS